MKKWMLGIGLVVAVCLFRFSFSDDHSNKPSPRPTRQKTLFDFGVVGDGKADDTAAIQKAVDSGLGTIHFGKGVYKITKPIVIDLDKVGFTSLSGDGTAQIRMAGAGPAFRFVGTHGGTAAPASVKDNVWSRQRTPMVDAIEIVGDHPEACGIEARGTMQLTLTRLVVRKALHAVHLIERNRNVLLSECHLYENNGIGVFLDRLNLHQINIANCHISYNQGGGVVARQSEIRNLQIGTCDIEGNQGPEGSKPTANVLLDSTGSSIGEVTILGCTIQHGHESPNSANIRINGESTKRPFTPEQRHGNITIADNVLSDVQVNIEIQNVRGATITGNTIWKGYTHNLAIDQCENLIVANNVFDRNPRYHYGDGPTAKLGLVFTNSTNCTISGNHLNGVGDVPAAMELHDCNGMNLTNCGIHNFGKCGLLLDNVQNSRVSGCLIQNAEDTSEATSLRVTQSQGNLIMDNLLGNRVEIHAQAGVVKDNFQPGNPPRPILPADGKE